MTKPCAMPRKQRTEVASNFIPNRCDEMSDECTVQETVYYLSLSRERAITTVDSD